MKNVIKISCRISVLIGMFAIGAVIAADSQDPEQKLLGYWRFDEGSGSTVSDSSGSGMDGEIMNDMRAVEWVDGRNGKSALKFSGAKEGNQSGCVRIPKFNFDLRKGMTVMVWIKINQNAKAEDMYTIIGNQKDNMGPGFHFYFNCRNFMLMSGDGNEMWRAIAPVSASTSFDKWLHLAGTYNGSEYVLYINGEEVGKSETNKPFQNHFGELYIGSSYRGASYGFQGIIDEIKIYNYALSQKEILSEAKLQ